MTGVKVIIVTYGEYGELLVHGIAYKQGIGNKKKFYTEDGKLLDVKNNPFLFYLEKDFNKLYSGVPKVDKDNVEELKNYINGKKVFMLELNDLETFV